MKTLLFLLLLWAVSPAVYSQDRESESLTESETEILRELNQIHTMGKDWHAKLEEGRSRASEIDPTITTVRGPQQDGLYD